MSEQDPQVPAELAVTGIPNVSLSRAARAGEHTEDELLLARPRLNQPVARVKERGQFTHGDTWRVLRITGEFVHAFDALAEVGSAVTIFGSARTKPDDPMYQAAREVAGLLAKAGFAVITGGGPGIMEAANRGASDAGGRTIGLNIGLPFEQRPNAYISRGLSFEFHYFFMRKLWFAHLARAVVVFPGGFGTLDEMIELLTLQQTRKLDRTVPILLYGSAYWKEVINFDALVRYGMISAEDLRLFRFVDEPAMALSLLQNSLTVENDPATPAIASSRTCEA